MAKESKYVVTIDEWGKITTTLDLRDEHLSAFIAELGRAQGVFINMAIAKAARK